MTFKQYLLLAAAAALSLGLLSAAEGGSFAGSNGRIAFTCGSNVCTVASDGSGAATVASNASDPSWSADGTKLAYVGGGGVTIANADGSSPQVLVAGGTQPTWAANGSRIAYVKAGDVYGINTNTSGGEQNLTNSAATDADPAYSPDGTKIVFASNSAGTYDLWTLAVSNPSSLVHVTTGSGDERSPSWSPDGDTLVYSDAGTLYLVDPDGGDTPTTLGVAGTDPAFSPDGTRVTYIDASGKLATVSAIGTDVQVIHNSTNDAQPDWQPVGSSAPPVSGSGPPSNVTYPIVNLPAGAAAPVVGQALASSVGTWSGSTPLTYTYQWKRCDPADRLNGSCVNIQGATSASYAPTADDFGRRLRLAVTATNSQGSATQNSESTAPVVSLPAKVNATPPIEGQNMVGQTLSLGPGVWTGTLPIAFTYSWRRCNPTGDLPTCVEIPDATSDSYVPTPADIGYSIRVWVTGTNLNGSDVAITNHTYPIVDRPHFAPQPLDKPDVSGTFEVGRELQLGNVKTVFSGEGPVTTTVVWQRCDATGRACRSILGATKQVYAPTVSDVGYTLRVAITAANPYGSTTAQSDPSEPVLATPPHHAGRDIVGTSAVEYLAGSGWDDTILGLAGSDTLLGGAGDDKIDGGDGNDVLFGGAGVDTILGGAGSDTVYAADGQRDIVDCGPGRDHAVADAFDKLVGCELVDRLGG